MNQVFIDWMDRLKRKDEQAGEDLYRRFSCRLIGLAKTKIRPDLLRKIDPEDVVQSVFRSFFGCMVAGRFEVSNDEGLWAILALITVRKCTSKRRWFLAARRDYRLELEPNVENGESFGQSRCFAREPTPLETSILAEMLERVLDSLSERESIIISLHLNGYPKHDIVEKAGTSLRTVERVLRKVENRLISMSRDS